jgi:phosphatidylglycerol:prolipoprotein diacylglycerol transferase
VHPVQGYAGILYLTLALLLLVWLPARRQDGDVAGVALMGSGSVIYVTEFWRDWEGRGDLFHGVLDGPQAIAIGFVLFGAVILRARKTTLIATGAPNEFHVSPEVRNG